MRLRNFSLKYKFIATIVVFTLILSVSFAIISVSRLGEELKAQLLERGKGVADDLAKKFSDPFADPIELSKTLQMLYENISQGGEVVYLQIVKAGKDVFRIHDRRMGPLEPEHTPLLSELEIRIQRLPDGTPYFDLIRAIPCPDIWIDPITRECGVSSLGPSYVRLGLSLAYVQKQLRQEFFVFGALSFGFTGAGILIAFALYQMILGPLSILLESVKRFSRQRSARAHVKSGDELEALATEFNKMADLIEERDRTLEMKNKELTEANRVKSQFLAMMGHELLTPLHSIRGFSQILLEGIDGELNPAQRESLSAIKSSGDHLLELLNNILKYSKLEAGEEKLHLEEVEVRKLAEEVIQAFKPQMRGKDIAIEAEVNSIKLRADATKLKQILMNLLSNAVKYTRQGEIRIKAQERNSDILFVVQDTGIGIDKKYHNKLFEPFTQIETLSTKEHSGLGLGLAIVKKYVEMHGGRVWFESEPGRGSTFYFTIPNHH